jgi:AbrB family looped-hinge helix DNA binding protein
MPAVTVSPKFQVVIPKEIREAMKIVPGQKINMMIYRGNVILVPVLPMEDVLGFAKGIDTTIERDDDRI